MNSSSAFSNALSTLPVQAVVSPPTPRSPSADTAKAEFKKVLDDARSDQDIEPEKTCANKAPLAEKHANAKLAETAAPESPENLVEETATSDKKDTVDVVALVVADPIKVENSEPAVAIAGFSLESPLEPAVEQSLLGDIGLATESVTDSSALEADIPDVVATLTAPATSDETLLTAADQEPQQDPVMVAATPPVNAVVAAASDTESAAIASLNPFKGAEVKGDIATADSTADDVALLNEDAAAPTDAKAVFEKMLQAMTGSTGGNAGGDPQKAQEASVALASASPLSPAPGAESLLRGIETALPAARSFVVQTAVPVNVAQPQWSQAVGEKVLWLAAQNVHSAEIRLDPPELGPMMVKITVNQEQTSINFTSHHAGVREVLDQNLARLREMFNEQGLNLANVDVSEKSFQRQQGDGAEQQGQGGHGEQQQEEEAAVAISAIVHQRLVDHYA